MWCSNCGTELKDGDKFCGTCGFKVESPEENDIKQDDEKLFLDGAIGETKIDPEIDTEFDPEHDYKSKKKSSLKIIVVFAVVLLVAAMAAVAGMKILNKDDAVMVNSKKNQTTQQHTTNEQMIQEKTTQKETESFTTTKESTSPVTTEKNEDDNDAVKSRLIDNIPSDIVNPETNYKCVSKTVEADASVNLRSAPDKSSSKVGTVARSSLVYSLADSDDGEWSLIYYRYYNKYGWIASKYLSNVSAVQIDESGLNDGEVVVNGKEFSVGSVHEKSCKVNANVGLVLRDNIENGNWILRMEYGDSIKEICRSSTDSEWGYIEYTDGVRTYRGFANSKYYS